MTDRTAVARAMFEAFHAMADRPRNWNNQPDEDNGVESGRNTWLALADAALAVVGAEPAVVVEAPSPEPEPPPVPEADADGTPAMVA